MKESAERFGVSRMTVHRDLTTLERVGALRKVHGGATARPTSVYESSFDFRRMQATKKKELIARQAVRHIRPGSSILFDDSTTALTVLPLLASIPDVTIVTTFLGVVDKLRGLDTAGMGRFDLLVVGGQYRPKYHAFGGAFAIESLRGFHVDVALLSVSTVDPRTGAFHQEAEQAVLKRTMMEIADKAMLLVAAPKFAHRCSLHRVASLQAFEVVVVDKWLAPHYVQELQDRGVTYELAGEHEGDGLNGPPGDVAGV